jgi:hypothetical protein
LDPLKLPAYIPWFARRIRTWAIWAPSEEYGREKSRIALETGQLARTAAKEGPENMISICQPQKLP